MKKYTMTDDDAKAYACAYKKYTIKEWDFGQHPWLFVRVVLLLVIGIVLGGGVGFYLSKDMTDEGYGSFLLLGGVFVGVVFALLLIRFVFVGVRDATQDKTDTDLIE